MSDIPSVSGEGKDYDSVHGPHMPHFYPPLTEEKEVQMKKLYKQLDSDGDGKIDVKDLTSALRKKMSGADAKEYAEKIIEKANRGTEADSNIEFADFVHYILEHEKKMALVFRELDRNADGRVDPQEVASYFSNLGITLSTHESETLVNKMDKDGNMMIDLDEFQEYFLFHPSVDPKDIAHFWRHSLMIDIGESGAVPEDFSETEIQQGAWWRHLVAGGCAGGVSRTSTAPLDRLKIYMQVHASKANQLNLVSGMRYLLSEGGIQSLWRGNGVNVIKIAPEQAIKFMAYEQIKRIIKGKSMKDLSVIERFCAGSLAGAVSQTVIYPMEVLKTRLALRKTGQLNRGIFHAAYTIGSKEGVRAFSRGYIPNTIGIIPYAGIDLATYETLKKWYTKSHMKQEPGVLALLACGTISSTCGQLASYPLALVRTKLQALAISGQKDQPDTMLKTFQYIYRNEGFSGLYRGLTPNFMKVLPAVSISYVVYETVRKQLGVKMT